MVIVALLAFGLMLVAWIVAPAEPLLPAVEPSLEHPELALAEAA